MGEIVGRIGVVPETEDDNVLTFARAAHEMVNTDAVRQGWAILFIKPDGEWSWATAPEMSPPLVHFMAHSLMLDALEIIIPETADK